MKLRYTGLNSEKRYKIRLIYYSEDAGAVYQSITNAASNPITPSFKLSNVKTTYEYAVSQAYYADG